jgi:hypothetical protein
MEHLDGRRQPSPQRDAYSAGAVVLPDGLSLHLLRIEDDAVVLAGRQPGPGDVQFEPQHLLHFPALLLSGEIDVRGWGRSA